MRSASRTLLAVALVLLSLAAIPAAQAVENDEHHWVGHDRAGTIQSPASSKGRG